MRFSLKAVGAVAYIWCGRSWGGTKMSVEPTVEVSSKVPNGARFVKPLTASVLQGKQH